MSADLLRFRQLERSAPVRLTPRQRERLAGLTLHPRRESDGRFTLYTQDKTGSFEVADGEERLRIVVEPKIRPSRLLFLMGYALDPDKWREDDAGLGEETGLVPAIGYLFGRRAERVLRRHLMHGYVSVDRTAHEVRGRIRIGDQLRARPGLAIPVETTHDEFTPDIAENRLLLAAARRLLRLPGLPAPAEAPLRAVLRMLRGVSPLPRGELPDWRPGRAGAPYRPLLRLAELVLRGDSCDVGDGETVTVDGFLVRSDVVYERFIAAALTRSLRRHGGTCQTKPQRYLLRGDLQKLEPDLLYTPASGPSTVVDAKYYLPGQKNLVDREAFFQMLAYCLRFEARTAHLVYAALTERETVERTVAGSSGIRFRQHFLDLDRPPAQILAAVDGIADAVARG